MGEEDPLMKKEQTTTNLRQRGTIKIIRIIGILNSIRLKLKIGRITRENNGLETGYQMARKTF